MSSPLRLAMSARLSMASRLGIPVGAGPLGGALLVWGLPACPSATGSAMAASSLPASALAAFAPLGFPIGRAVAPRVVSLIGWAPILALRDGLAFQFAQVSARLI